MDDYVLTGIGFLIGMLCGYYLFTHSWQILSNMAIYILLVFLILYFKKRRLRLKGGTQKRCT